MEELEVTILPGRARSVTHPSFISSHFGGTIDSDLRSAFGLAGQDSFMGYPSGSAKGMARTAGLRMLRRATVLFLLAAINYMLLQDWRTSDQSLLSVAPSAGSGGVRPLGEVCTVNGKPLQRDVIKNRHAVVFDAGSTGSRVHVYEFQYCGKALSLLADEVFEETKPGLSHYHENPPLAAQSLHPLLQTALQRVPHFLQKCTPLVVKATAGLRLLPATAVESILRSVRSLLSMHSFRLHGAQASPDDAVAVMDGSEEGVLAWVTVNFLQGKLKPAAQLASPLRAADTSAVLDLGGGSTQIVFAVAPELLEALRLDPAQQAQFYYKLKLHGNEIDLYQQSYLGYGLMEARKGVKSLYVKKMQSDRAGAKEMRFPCFPKDYREDFEQGGQAHTLAGDSSGWESCLDAVLPIFHKDKPCSVAPCSFSGVHQPAIHTKSLIAFSYFFDRLIPLGISSPLTIADIDREGRALCQALPTAHHKKLLADNPNWCLDVAYIYSLLRVGYQIDLQQPIVVTKQINGYEAGWSLGAALKLLENSSDGC